MSFRYLSEANFDLSFGSECHSRAIETDTDLLGPVLIIIRIKWPRHSTIYNNIETMIRDKSRDASWRRGIWPRFTTLPDSAGFNYETNLSILCLNKMISIMPVQTYINSRYCFPTYYFIRDRDRNRNWPQQTLSLSLSLRAFCSVQITV